MLSIKRGRFLSEMDSQCEGALKAFPHKPYDEDVFHRIQTFLSCRANISKLLWASSEGLASTEREPLRAELSVTDQSPLSRASRKVRNKMEHIDEMIDEWAEIPRTSYVSIDRVVSPRILKLVSGISMTSKDVFRQFDPDTERCTSGSTRLIYKYCTKRLGGFIRTRKDVRAHHHS